MRIAVVGSGVSGLVAARLLSQNHEVVVFESQPRIGGHVNTVTVGVDGERHQIDTGFIVYNEKTYPIFSEILADLEVKSDCTSMSFSVQCDRTGLEYNGTSLNGLFAQRKNLVKPSFLRMIRDILRFNRIGPLDVDEIGDEMSVGEYLKRRRFSKEFAVHYLLPMGSAIWSCPWSEFSKFPIRFILQFYVNHGLLSVRGRPQWRVIRGGSQTYVDRLIQPFRHSIRINCPVRSITRSENDVRVVHDEGDDRFDEIVIACHSDQALQMLSDPDPLESEILSAFPYGSNSAVLHTDTSLLPNNHRAWASWNYHVPVGEASRPTLTYNMNMLQGISSASTFCVTLNEDEAIDDEKVLARFRYSHPLFDSNRSKMQKRHNQVIRYRRTSYCGAYWRNGFHEDGVVSALAVCRRYGIDGWSNNASTPHLANGGNG